MARIREYESEVAAVGMPQSRKAQPSDFGGTGLLMAGKLLGEVGDEVYAKTVADEKAQVETAWADRTAHWTVELEKRTNAAPAGDNSYMEGFIEEFSNDVSRIAEPLTTADARQTFERRQAATVAHFKQSAGMTAVQSAGVKAVQDYTTALEARRNAVMADPSQFRLALDAMTESLHDPQSIYARMPAAAREKLTTETRQNLALSAVRGIIGKNPEMALAELKDGTWAPYLDADNAAALVRQAEQGVEGREIEASRRDLAARRAQRDAQEKTADDFIKRLTRNDLSTDQVLASNLPAFGEGSKATFLNLLKKGDGPDRDSRTYGPAFVDLFRRVSLADGDPAKITDETALYKSLENGEITYSGIQALRAEMQGRRSLEGNIENELKKRMLDLAKSQLTGSDPLLRLRDPKGDERLQVFVAWFLPEYQRQRAAGKTAVQLLNPESADYMGSGLKLFRRAPGEYMRDLLNDNPGNPNLAIPGAGAAAADPALPAPKSKAEYDALPSGARYQAPDGVTRIKQGKGTASDNPAASYQNKDDVAADYRAGKISREDASRILREKGWAR